jgi:hypothetical protein
VGSALGRLHAAPAGSGLATLPADLDLVIELDLQAMRSSPLLQTVLQEYFGAPDESLTQRCGFDPLQQIQRVTLGTRDSGAPGSEFIAVAQTDLAESLLMGCLTRIGGTRLRASVIGARTIWQSDDGTMMLAQAAPGSFLVGSSMLVMQSLAVVDGAMPSAQTNRVLVDALASIASVHAARAVSVCSPRTRRRDGFCGSPDAQGIVSMAGGLSMSTDLLIDVRSTFDSDSIAAARGDLLKSVMLTMLAGLQVPRGEVQVSVDVSGPHVDMTYRLSGAGVLEAVRRQKRSSPTFP